MVKRKPRSMTTLERALLGVTLGEAPSLVPGTILAFAVALLANWLAQLIGTSLMGLQRSPISGITVAIVLGLLARNTVGVPALFQPGLNFCVKKLLRLGIVLLGVRLSLIDLFKVSLTALPIIIVVLTMALFVIWKVSLRLHLPERLGILTAVGTSICGTSAIMAIAPCIDASEEEVSYSVANMALFGLLAMLFYPALAHLLFGASPLLAGLFMGTSIHQTAQVTGAALMYDGQFAGPSPTAGEVAVIAKLVRNALITIVIPLVSLFYSQRCSKVEGDRRLTSFLQHFPVFVFGFLVMSLLRTLGDAGISGGGRAIGLWAEADWSGLTATLADWAKLLLTVAMASVGLGTSYRVLKGLGIRPLALGLIASVLVATISGVIIVVLGPLIV